MDFAHILSLLGGVAFFLYGMSTMGTGLKKVAGPKLESYLWKLSSTPVKGFLLGTLVAAIIQSSSATSVMVVSFVNAGMMKLTQAICIILGSNVGTTMTGWLLTLSNMSGNGLMSQIFSTAALIALLALTGIIMNMFLKKNSTKNLGLIFLGLGILLLSMTLINDAVSPLKESDSFKSLLLMFSNPFLGILAGTLVAAVVQSSSAGVGILQALCVTGAIPYSVCLPVILGINVGASVPVLFSMMDSSKNGKRAALTYLFSNVFGLVIIYILYFPFRLIVGADFFTQASTTMGIAVMNTVIRVVVAILLLPLHSQLEKLALKIVKFDKKENEDLEEIDSLSDSVLDYTPVALEKASIATNKMCFIAYRNVNRALRIVREFDKASFDKVQVKEELIDKYEDKVGNFVVKIGRHSLSKTQQARVSELLSSVGDFERLSDHAVNLSEAALEIYEKKIVFSEPAQKEIDLLIKAGVEIITLAYEAFTEKKIENVNKIDALEEVIDEMTKRMRASHIERVQTEDCTMEMGFVFNDLLVNIERVSDHCSNIAFCIMHSVDIDAEGHEFEEKLSSNQAYNDCLEEYKKLYLSAV